jgi:hypothetical protein
LPLMLLARRSAPLYVHHDLASSLSGEPDPQTSSRKIPSSKALRKALHRRALRSRSALAPQGRLSSAAMRPSILRASTAMSSCATRAPERHATMESMTRAASEEQCCYTLNIKGSGGA